FQTAAVVGADGYLDAEDVARVGRVLFEGAGYTARALENSLADLVRRGVLEPAAAAALGARLRAAGVLPPGAEKGARWRRVRGAPPAPTSWVRSAPSTAGKGRWRRRPSTCSS